MHFSAIALAFVGALGAVNALPSTLEADLGINCRGNGNCASQGDNALSQIHGKIASLPQDKTFNNGDHVACGGGTGNICCFFQNVNNGPKTAAQALTAITNLQSHGCNTCGSDPTEPGNNVADGELTCNWVSNP